jgi:glutamine kinase
MANTLSFSSKSSSLLLVSQFCHLPGASVPKIFCISYANFNGNKNKLVDEIKSFFIGDEYLIIRSSADNEDSSAASNAGKYLSIPNVSLDDDTSIINSIQKVFDSYADHLHVHQEIFIQPMLTQVSIAGVLLTSTLQKKSPYYVVEYSLDGKTDSVTKGDKKTKTLLCCKYNIDNKSLKQWQKHLFSSAQILMSAFNNEHIDIEFAFDTQHKLHILQIRPIVYTTDNSIPTKDIQRAINSLYKKIKKLSKPRPGLLGKSTMWGVMPDWNPAEILGAHPRPLSLSLYKELITDSIWAAQRADYGYRNLKSHPLMYSFYGLPYIDMRADFNSFIPAKLDETISAKLAQCYIDMMHENPHFHDKVEFEIVSSCYSFDMEKKMLRLEKYGLGRNETKRLEFALLDITNNIICPNNGLLKTDLEKIELLPGMHEEIINSELSLPEKIYWLIERCKNFGTLPFAGIARAAFVAKQLLDSLVETQCLSKEEHHLFLSSLQTTAGEIKEDFLRMTKNTFIDKYGHLRPGSYDILSATYKDDFENIFKNIVNTTTQQHRNNQKHAFHLKLEKKNKISNMCREHGMNFSVDELFLFITKALQGREEAKFIFTRTLSQIIDYIAELGADNDFSRDDISYLDLECILKLYSSIDNIPIKSDFSINIHRNKNVYKIAKLLSIPKLILNPNDIYTYELNDDEPNFITQQKVEAEIASLSSKNNNAFPENLSNKIICIPSADPGYDYLFAKNISGLITMYGGCNSHMAIRCSELGIPAIIGIGENWYNKVSRSKIVSIDADNKIFNIVG